MRDSTVAWSRHGGHCTLFVCLFGTLWKCHGKSLLAEMHCNKRRSKLSRSHQGTFFEFNCTFSVWAVNWLSLSIYLPLPVVVVVQWWCVFWCVFWCALDVFFMCSWRVFDVFLMYFCCVFDVLFLIWVLMSFDVFSMCILMCFWCVFWCVN